MAPIASCRRAVRESCARSKRRSSGTNEGVVGSDPVAASAAAVGMSNTSAGLGAGGGAPGGRPPPWVPDGGGVTWTAPVGLGDAALRPADPLVPDTPLPLVFEPASPDPVPSASMSTELSDNSVTGFVGGSDVPSGGAPGVSAGRDGDVKAWVTDSRVAGAIWPADGHTSPRTLFTPRMLSTMSAGSVSAAVVTWG